jgi:hypothetical protein
MECRNGEVRDREKVLHERKAVDSPIRTLPEAGIDCDASVLPELTNVMPV